jgi:hypothetical protein
MRSDSNDVLLVIVFLREGRRNIYGVYMDKIALNGTHEVDN